MHRRDVLAMVTEHVNWIDSATLVNACSQAVRPAVERRPANSEFPANWVRPLRVRSISSTGVRGISQRTAEESGQRRAPSPLEATPQQLR
jgi:hypothetical protein